MKTFVKHIALIFACCALLCAGALQYAHDVSHGNAKGDDAEGCSLCWFVLHQTAGAVPSVPDFIEPPVQPVSVCKNSNYLVFIPLRFILRESNKDPPGRFFC